MSSRMSKRVVLIGWDAADWEFLNPLLEAGQMPVLNRFIETGVIGKIATLRPILSPILWNSIATGKRGDKHGILGFTEPDGKGSTRPVTSTSRKAKAIWNILSQQSLRSTVIGWFASHPAEPIHGNIVTDRFQHVGQPTGNDHPLDRHSIHPRELYDVLEPLRIGLGDLTPEQLLPFIPHAAEMDQQSDRRLWRLAEKLAECSTVHNAATALIGRDDWDFFAVYYSAIDSFGHGFMKFHPPQQSHVSDSEFRLFKDVMTSCYLFHDMMLGRLLGLLNPDTTVILVSDHGFKSGLSRPGKANVTLPGQFEPEDSPLLWHRSHGILAVNGPNIRRDEVTHGASLLDIAPTILHMFGLKVGRDMEGHALTNIFTTKTTVEYTDSYEPPHPDDGVHRGEYAEDVYSADLVMKQLADLGYIEPVGEDKAKATAKVNNERLDNLAQIQYATGHYLDCLKTLKLLEAHERVDHVRLQSRFALCLISMGHHAKAEPYVCKAIKLDSDAALPRMLLGQIYSVSGRVDEAISLFEEVQSKHLHMPTVHNELGKIHLRMARVEQAETAFRKAVGIDYDNAEAHAGLAESLAIQGKFEDALKEYMRSVSLQHSNAKTHLLMGDTLIRLGQVEWAIRAYEVAAEVKPSYPLPHRRLAHVYMHQLKNADEAMRSLAMAKNLRVKMKQSASIARKLEKVHPEDVAIDEILASVPPETA
jgi:predicted AlkP superfamily phosphohydrolase/phosphomutase/tetratricopeptide (TPR) repeat protein